MLLCLQEERKELSTEFPDAEFSLRAERKASPAPPAKEKEDSGQAKEKTDSGPEKEKTDPDDPAE